MWADDIKEAALNGTVKRVVIILFCEFIRT